MLQLHLRLNHPNLPLPLPVEQHLVVSELHVLVVQHHHHYPQNPQNRDVAFPCPHQFHRFLLYLRHQRCLRFQQRHQEKYFLNQKTIALDFLPTRLDQQNRLFHFRQSHQSWNKKIL